MNHQGSFSLTFVSPEQIFGVKVKIARMPVRENPVCCGGRSQQQTVSFVTLCERLLFDKRTDQPED